MLAEQRRAGAMPNVEHRAVLAEPEISAALAKGERITAIRLVRKRTGLGLREAKRAYRARDTLSFLQRPAYFEICPRIAPAGTRHCGR